MKKRTVIFSVILIFTVAVIFMLHNRYECNVADSKIQDHVISYADLNNYGVDAKLYDKKAKLAIVKCKVKNRSFNTIDNIYVKFSDTNRIPANVLGTKIETGLPWPVSLKPFSERTVEFSFLMNHESNITGIKIDFVRETVHKNQVKIKHLFDVIL